MMEVLSAIGILGLVYVIGAMAMFGHVISELGDIGENPIFMILGLGLAALAALFWPAVFCGLVWEKVSNFFSKEST